ncbi:hypothetical protein D1Z98_11245 [Riemerella anatipestifer]|uniref:hypothetical protein n=1 Tax=Riemerella anatipestifer TaxID=34085 RepID=UPI00129EDDD2|nr:hypothetical protein [Riemerella anatipestifer]MRM95496.1 hypothetical protein [Riemerella anatipestifer]
MTDTKNEAGNLLPLTVTKGVTVNVLPYEQYEYLMATKEVANGYGISEYAVRVSKMRHESELIEGKHYVIAEKVGVTKCNGGLKIPHNAVLWTKRGIVRLGFFIKSERAKLFRDWAEELIIRVNEQRDLFGTVVTPKALPKRKHNRLTPMRMVEILADVAKIEDRALRLSLIEKLGV